MAAVNVQDINKDILQDEKLSVLTYIRRQRDIILSFEYCAKKNIVYSVRYRQEGNKLYKSKLHDQQVHEKIWKLYSQSIAFAPYNSEELALGYGNRSALLFHLEIYKDCVKDCDGAIQLNSSVLLKVKLLCRKAKCLAFLKETSTKDVISEASEIISKLPLNSAVVSDIEA